MNRLTSRGWHEVNRYPFVKYFFASSVVIGPPGAIAGQVAFEVGLAHKATAI